MQCALGDLDVEAPVGGEPERLDRVALGIDREAFDAEYSGRYGGQVGRQNSGTALPPSMDFDRNLSSTGIFYFDPHRREVDRNTLIWNGREDSVAPIGRLSRHHAALAPHSVSP